MKKLLISSICAAALFFPPLTSHAEAASAFGFTFGQKIEAPQCGGTEQYPSRPNEGYCLVFSKITGYLGNPAHTGFVSASFNFSDLPFWTRGKLSLYLIDGKIEGIVASTGGSTTNISVTNALLEKYGQPTDKLETTIQNGFGADFDGTILIWNLPDVKVKYFPILENIKSGRLDIFSSTGYETYKRSIKAAEKPSARGL